MCTKSTVEIIQQCQMRNYSADRLVGLGAKWVKEKLCRDVWEV